MIVTLYSS